MADAVGEFATVDAEDQGPGNMPGFTQVGIHVLLEVPFQPLGDGGRITGECAVVAVGDVVLIVLAIGNVDIQIKRRLVIVDYFHDRA